MSVPKLRFKADDGSEFPEWEEILFKNLVREYSDRTKRENEDMLLSASIEGMFLNSELFDHQRGSSNIGYKKIKYESLILSTQNLHLGNANVNLRFSHGMVSPAYKTYDIVNCSVEFMAQWVKTEFAKRFFYNATTVGASLCRRNVEWNDLYNQGLMIPSNVKEQEKIAGCLFAIDNVIDQTQSEIDAWEKQKRSVMQLLFGQKVRFKADDGSEFPEWEEKLLSDVLAIDTCMNNGRFEKEDILSVSDQYGVVNQLKLQGRSFAGESIDNYKIVQKGQIIYTRSPLRKKPFGIIKIVGDVEGIVSPLYIVNTVKQDNDALFIYYYFDTPERTNNYLKPLVRMGAKHTMNISNDEWLVGNVYIPSFREQQKIAACLSAFDTVIDKAKQELSAYRELKKGLLQQMFV